MTEQATEQSSKSSLHTKLSSMQGKLKTVPKSGRNSFHNYSYSTEADVLDTVRDLCSEAEVSLTTSCTEYQVRTIDRASDRGIKYVNIATVSVETSLVDSATGEKISATMPGYAEDSKGDKAIYKALTGATKYAVWKLFALSTGDDSEADNDAQHVSGKPATPPSRTSVAALNLITDAQRKRLFAIAKTKEVPNDSLKTLVESHGFESSHDITREAYDKIIRDLEAM